MKRTFVSNVELWMFYEWMNYDNLWIYYGYIKLML